ncbi:V-type ATP synthase subunit E [Frisingicoccus sp.]|uniref:V-type ATP synthase subunit E n=1 Tax=Frisingicoccus sp. TaxID=1918627 RepID=UPI003AB68D56
MSGLEKITSQILEEAKTSAAMKLETARKEADDILSKAKEACAAMEAEAAEKNVILKENYEGRIKSSAEQQRRTALLRAKQDMIAEVIEEAYVTLKQEDTESYFRTMEKILKTYVLAEPGEIYFSAQDLARMPADFEKRISAAAEEKGGSLVLSKEPKAIEDGFILVYGGIEENCTLKALLDAKKDELQDKVNEILFL